MLMIRLARFGKKNAPTFRVVVSDKKKDTLGNYLEKVGHYNPRSNPKTVEFKAERIKYWLSKGAQCSPTVHNLLVSQGIVEGKKVQAFKIKKKSTPDSSSAPKATEDKPIEVPADEKGENKEEANKTDEKIKGDEKTTEEEPKSDQKTEDKKE